MTSERLMYVQFTSCVYGIISIDFDNDLIPSVEAYYESSQTVELLVSFGLRLFSQTNFNLDVWWSSEHALAEYWQNYTDCGYTFGIAHLILTKFFMTLEYILMVFVSIKLQLGKARKALNQLILLLEMSVLNIADPL